MANPLINSGDAVLVVYSALWASYNVIGGGKKCDIALLRGIFWQFNDEEGHQIVMPFVSEEGWLHHTFLYSFLD